MGSNPAPSYIAEPRGDGEFDSPPSPPRTRKVILRARKLVRGIFFVKDYAAAFSGCGYLEKSTESWLGFQGYNGSLLYGVNVHRFQHGGEQLPAF